MLSRGNVAEGAQAGKDNAMKGFDEVLIALKSVGTMTGLRELAELSGDK